MVTDNWEQKLKREPVFLPYAYELIYTLSSSSLLYGKNVLKVFLQMEYKICSTYETNVIFPTKLSTHIF